MFGFFETVIESLVLLISYISNNNSFPQPLSAKEEAECLELYKNGDIVAKNKLIEHNLRLVAHIAKKYSASVKDNEDLISIGTIGLIKGISSFDLNKGTRLATYVARCIDNEILMLLRSQKKMQGDISLNDSIGTDKEGNQIMLMDIMSNDEDDIFDEIETNTQIKQLYVNIRNQLDERERKVIVLRYGLAQTPPKTQREIAKMMGISRSYVSRIEKKALGTLKKEFEKGG
ncbi:MAG: RNA polymerase sporulation sigma factor SigK [Oscillospiraceae bacterium]